MLKGISIVEKLKKYVELLDLTSRFGSIPMNNKKKEGVEASQLSLSSLNSPLLMRSKSFFKHSPKSFKRSGHTYFQEKLDPMEDFTKRFNQMQNNKINSNNKLKNIRDMKREIKQIVQTAKKRKNKKKCLSIIKLGFILFKFHFFFNLFSRGS